MKRLILYCLISLILTSCKFDKEKSSRIKCIQNLKQIHFALEAYANDNNGNYPNKNNFLGLKILVDGQYLKNSSLICPRNKEKNNCSYHYIGGLNKGLDKNMPVCWDKKNNHQYKDNIYGNVLYLDGHIKGYAYEKWAQFFELEMKREEPSPL